MNLARVLEESAEEVPALSQRQALPRPHPRLVVREHQERDGKIFVMLIPGRRPPCYFRVTELQYRVAMLFDGQRTPAQVAQVAASQLGVQLTTEDVTAFAEMLEDWQFWYRTPQEESVALCHHLMHERKLKLKQKDPSVAGDLSMVILWSFDPDKYLTWVHRHFAWIYSRWFSYWSLFMLLVCGIILGSHWQEVWSDSVRFYQLTGHGIGHVLLFFGTFLVLGSIHETWHGLTCKHFGGEVHRMGAMLVYLAPCAFCDISEAWVYGGRWERIITVFFGVWSEIVMCTYASVVWWLTPPGTLLHQAAYLVILSGGIFCVIVNWNPLAKLDGYIMMSEYLGIKDVKVVATQWLVSWIRARIFRLPGTVQPLNRGRAISYSVYAVLSGAYSYLMLLFFVKVLYHIVYYYTAQWAFVPAGALALLTFKSRIKKLGKFMKDVYVDKKELLRARRRPILAAAAGLLVLGLLPLRRETVQERFVLEPAQRAVIRAQVPGRVIDIDVREGEHVEAGSPVARLRDLGIQGQTALAAAQYRTAEAGAFNAQLQYADMAAADQKLRQAKIVLASAKNREQQLTIVSPFAGTVITPRLHDLLGARLSAGDEIAEVADVSTVRARIFVPENEMKKLLRIHDTVLRMDSAWMGVNGTVLSISPTSRQPDAGLMPTPDYRGTKAPEFFVVTVEVKNPDGRYLDGMTGTAKIHGARRSVFAVWLDPLTTAIARRLW
jgi:putative peptide zinc metalloprotease protein